MQVLYDDDGNASSYIYSRVKMSVHTFTMINAKFCQHQPVFKTKPLSEIVINQVPRTKLKANGQNIFRG